MSDKETPLRVKPVYEDSNELDPVLYASEDPDIYLAFRRQMWEALAPTDEVERLLAAGVVNDHWEAMRYRRMLPKFVASCEGEGLRALLATLPLALDRVDRLVRAFSAGEDAGELAGVLAAAGHDLETVRAKTMALRIDAIGKLEHLLIAKEKRRDRSLRDLIRRQAARREAAQVHHAQGSA